MPAQGDKDGEGVMTTVQLPKSVALSGDEAVAAAIRQCNVDVVAAYPITPQTIIVEKLSEYVANGEYGGEFVSVESEHSAMSACIGASATGARVFTATSSQGLALMHEALYNASGMRMPIVMAVVNRSLSAPLVLTADHGDMMGSRDSGWIQVYAENVQEIYDRTIQMFKVSEHPDVRLPSSVNFEGFILSHNVQAVKTLPDETVHQFVGRPKFNVTLDPSSANTFGAIGSADTYYEFKMQQVRAFQSSLGVFKEVDKEYGGISGRYYGTVGKYNTENADYVAVLNGCTAGTMKAAAKAINKEGGNVGVLSIKLFRPFPAEDILNDIKGAKAVVVMDRSLSMGAPAGPLSEDIRAAMKDEGLDMPTLSISYSIGGRDFSIEDGRKVFSMLKEPSSFGSGTIFYGAKE